MADYGWLNMTGDKATGADYMECSSDAFKAVIRRRRRTSSDVHG